MSTYATCTYCDHTGPDVNPGGPSLDALSDDALCNDEDACVGRREEHEAKRRRARFKAKQAAARPQPSRDTTEQGDT